MIAGQQSNGMLSIERYTHILNICCVVESVVMGLLIRILPYVVFRS